MQFVILHPHLLPSGLESRSLHFRHSNLPIVTEGNTGRQITLKDTDFTEAIAPFERTIYLFCVLIALLFDFGSLEFSQSNDLVRVSWIFL